MYLFCSRFSKLPKASKSDADSQDKSRADGDPRAVAVVRLAVTGLHVVIVGAAILLHVLVPAAGAGYLFICKEVYFCNPARNDMNTDHGWLKKYEP